MASKELIEEIDSITTQVMNGGIDASAAADFLLGEQLTKGIKNAMAKGKTKVKCDSCDLAIPVYPGRYPKKCPECDCDFHPEPVVEPGEEPKE